MVDHNDDEKPLIVSKPQIINERIFHTPQEHTVKSQTIRSENTGCGKYILLVLLIFIFLLFLWFLIN